MARCRRQSEIANALGLHLRAAGEFVRVALQYQAQVCVCLEGKVADGKSILDLIMLAAGPGTRLELEANGPDADAALEALCRLIEARFNEQDC
jgi:phosphocarrier protein HPr